MKERQWTYKGTLHLESGQTIENPVIAYHISNEDTIGEKPVVWICHALTANSNAAEWWPGLVGGGKCYDPALYTIVCANVLGSCYGTTGPQSINPATGKPWLRDFPLITVRDMVSCHMLLSRHLGIDRIHTLIGGSIGGFQSMEWAIMDPNVAEHLIAIGSGSHATPWAIAINEAERMAIEADRSFDNLDPCGGQAGLAAARAIGLLSYRSYEAYNLTQKETDVNKTDAFKAASYQRYQGEKLIRRFDAYSYYSITKSQDTHNVGRNRQCIEEALAGIRAKTLVVAIDTDSLFPVPEQKAFAAAIPGAAYHEIRSHFAHDGFLLEYQQLSKAIDNFYKTQDTNDNK